MSALQTKALLDALLAVSDDAVIVTDTHGTILSWSPGGARLFGYDAAEVTGRHVGMVIPGDMLGKSGVQDKPTRCELTCAAKDGRAVSAAMTTSCIRHANGQPNAVLYILKDMSGRKMLERQLKETREYVNSVLDHIPDPIFMKDRQHRWIGGNKAFWDLLSGPAEKFLGKSDYDFFPKEEADHFWEIDDRVFGGEVITTEEKLTRPDGELHVLSTKKAAFPGEQGEFLVGVIRDITQLKKTEEQLRGYTRQLERSNQELEDFAHVASHDLKEPLRGLICQATFLKEDYRDKIDGAGVRRLDRIVALGKRMDSLVNELLYFARLGYGDLAFGETDPNVLVEEIRLLISPLLRECNARVIVPHPLPKIVCHKPGVTEVLRTLVTNGVKYNDKPERIVEVGFLASANSPNGPEENVFYVKDNGVGIAREHFKEVFRMFRRLEPQAADSASGSGTGAGLTFVKKIVDRCGGRIWIDSEVGKGSTFFFTLGPLAKPQ